MKKLILICLTFIGCAEHKDKMNLGLVNKLPKGEYVIWNTGSRHIVKCLKPNGEYYYLNDANFDLNGINAKDAHQFSEKTSISIP